MPAPERSQNALPWAGRSSLLELTTKLESVHQARTAAERDAIYEFRYAVRVGYRGQHEGEGFDHERRVISLLEDDMPSTTHLYTGTLEELDAVARVRAWAPGEVPDEVRERWSLDFVTNLDALSIAEFSELLARPEARNPGRLSVLSLFKACFERCLEPGGADLIVFDAHPGLVSHYAKLLGARRYGGEFIGGRAGKGVGVPMVIAPSDTEHLERVGSIFTPQAWKTFTLGRRRSADIGSFSVRFVDDLRDYVDPDKTWPAMEERFFRRGVERWSFFEGLRDAVVEELMGRGIVRELREGEALIAEGVGDAGMFVVIEGCLEIVVNGKSVDVAGKGELVGEIALLSPKRRRTATVKALVPSKALVLTHSALRALNQGDPEAGFQVMLNLARFIAERFSQKAQVVSSLDRQLAELQRELAEQRERARGGL